MSIAQIPQNERKYLLEGHRWPELQDLFRHKTVLNQQRTAINCNESSKNKDLSPKLTLSLNPSPQAWGEGL
jgi:hypothetical protein